MSANLAKKTTALGSHAGSTGPSSLPTLILLEREARMAESIEHLAFIAANETHRLVDFYQCILWLKTSSGGIKIYKISGVSEIDHHSQAVLSLTRMVKSLAQAKNSAEIKVVSKSELSDKLHGEWEEWIPDTALWCPLQRPGGELIGGMLFSRERPFTAAEISLLQPLLEAYGHAWNALDISSRRQHGRYFSALAKRPVRIGALLILIGILVLPVRESVLAPAEIVAVDPLVVSAPASGVIKRFHVRPNQTVRKGQILFTLDDTEIRSQHEIASMSLSTARAEYLRAAQKAFSDAQSKSEVELFRARVEEAALKLDYAKALLERTQVRAQLPGIVVFGDENDWIGQPVAMGQKILTLADPASTEIQIWLSVEDAISLDAGAEVQMFLHTDPTSPLQAIVGQTSYEPKETAAGNMAFPLKAGLVSAQTAPRIGLRGTAKVYGERVSIFYYVMRRPISALRQSLGF